MKQLPWMTIVWWVIGIAAAIWLWRYITTPPPGTEVTDLGRQHVSEEVVSQTTYSSNPPTSGPHMETWVKAGIFKEPQKEGELIHSLEHGYININYNCNADGSVKEASGSALNDTDACKQLVKQLEDVANAKKVWKLLMVPRPQLDTKIALAAWGRIDKFDTFDQKRIETFIDYWRDHGPEQTME
jgi:hypothetical protein